MNKTEFAFIILLGDLFLLLSMLIFITGYILDLNNDNKIKKFIMKHDKLVQLIMYSFIIIIDLIAIIIYAR